MLAAAAIPGVLPPVRWRGRLLADGGIADNTPVSHAVALGARRIYVLPTQNPGDRGLPRPPRAALATAVHAITLLTNARLHGDLARYAPSAELIVLPAANPGHIPPTDFGHAGQLITRALAAARTALATGTPNPSAAGLAPAGLWLAGPDVETDPTRPRPWAGSAACAVSGASALFRAVYASLAGFSGRGCARCRPRWRCQRSAITSPTGG